MITRSVVSSGLTPPSNSPMTVAIHAQAFDTVCLLVVGLDIVEDSIRFWIFFEVWL